MMFFALSHVDYISAIDHLPLSTLEVKNFRKNTKNNDFQTTYPNRQGRNFSHSPKNPRDHAWPCVTMNHHRINHNLILAKDSATCQNKHTIFSINLASSFCWQTLNVTHSFDLMIRRSLANEYKPQERQCLRRIEKYAKRFFAQNSVMLTIDLIKTSFPELAHPATQSI